MKDLRLERVRSAARLRQRRLAGAVKRQGAQASYLGWILLGLLPVIALLARGGAWFKGVLIVALAGVFLSYVLAPLVDELRRRFKRAGRPISRTVAICLVYCAVLLATGATWLAFSPRMDRQVEQLRSNAPQYLAVAANRLRAIDGWARGYLPDEIHEPVITVTRWMSSATRTHGLEILNELWAGWVYVPWLVLAPVVAFLLLNDAHRLRRAALRALPRGHVRWRVREFIRDVNMTLAGYVRAQLLSALIVGATCAAGLALLRVPYAFLLGVAAGVLEFVPAVGPLAVAVAATSLSSGLQAALALIFLGVVRALQDYVILPRLIRKGMHLHPAVVILAIWSGAQAGGIAGVFVALPIVGIMVTVARHWREYREIERLVAHSGVVSQPQLLE